MVRGTNQALFSKRNILSLQSFSVVFQFILTITLIFSAVTIRSQLEYIQTKDLGLRKKQTVVIPIRNEEIQNNFNAIKNQLSGISGVSGVSAISNLPWIRGFYDFNTTLNFSGKTIESNAYTLLVDRDFISTMGMQIKAGRSFQKNSALMILQLLL